MPIVRTGPVLHRSKGIVRTDISVTTDASGDATAALAGVGFGRLVGFLTDGGLDASATVTVKDQASGVTLFVYTTGTEGTPVYIYPSMPIQDQAGTVVTAAAANPNTNRPIVVAGKVTLTVAGGGNAETAIVSLIVDESYLGDVALTV